MWSRSLRNKKKEEGFTGAQQVYDCALDLLSYRDYSHKDMVERLQHKGATKAQALEAVAKLEDYGLLNEERYAQRVVRGLASQTLLRQTASADGADQARHTPGRGCGDYGTFYA